VINIIYWALYVVTELYRLYKVKKSVHKGRTSKKGMEREKEGRRREAKGSP